MTLRPSSAFLLALMLGAAATIAAVGCGPSKCGPGSCMGCCDSAGACVGGTSTAACGTNGAACSACSGTCTAGSCSMTGGGSAAGGAAGGGSAGGSSACANCSGCCQNGTCRAGSASNACGMGGAACLDCVSNNRICVAGQCQTECSAANCPSGCCQNNQCVTNLTAMTCGNGGAACIRCQAGEACLSGVCGTPDGGSNPDGGGLSDCMRTCVGCCDGAVCRVGTSPAACGNMGNLCVVCSNCQMVSGGGRCL